MLTAIRLRPAALIALMLVCLCVFGCAGGIVRLQSTDRRVAPGVAYGTRKYCRWSSMTPTTF